MIYVKFKEKHEDRILSGDSIEAIMHRVLQERVRDTWGDDNISVWYDDETELAQHALNAGPAAAYKFMASRRDYEYEGWDQIKVEHVG